MPCTDYGRTTTPEEEKAYLGYNRCELEDAFCSACTALEFAGVPIPPAAAAMWAAHKANDDKQRARESALPQYTYNLLTKCPHCLLDARCPMPDRVTLEQIDQVELKCPNGHTVSFAITRKV